MMKNLRFHDDHRNAPRWKLPGLLLLVLLAIPLFQPRPCQAQEGIIAASYYEEKTMLRKMWDARQAGNEDQVKELSLELQGFVNEKKNWAKDFLVLTRNSIRKLQETNNPDISDEERARKTDQIRDLQAQIRGLEQQLEEARLLYFQENYLDRLEIRKDEKMIPGIRAAGQKKIAEHETLIADNRPVIAGIKDRAAELIAEKDARIAELRKVFPLIEAEGEKFLNAEREMIAERQANLPRLQAEAEKALAAIDEQRQEQEDRKSLVRMGGFKRIKQLGEQIASLEKEISDQARRKQDTTYGKAQLAEARTQLRQTEDQIGKGTFASADGNWISMQQLNEEIRKKENEKLELSRNITAGTFSCASLNWVTRQALENEIATHQRIIVDTEQKIKDGGFSTAAVNWRTRNAVQGEIDKILQESREIRDTLAAGDFGCARFDWRTENSINREIAGWENVIAETRQQLSAGTFGCPEFNWRTEDSIRKRIAQLQESLKNRKEQFTSESYWNMGNLRREIDGLKLQVMTLEEESGLRDEKILALQAREQELKKYLAHDFLTALPEEESSFMKAIRWCSNAIQEVKAAADKFKKLKQVVDIVKTATNPAEAADRLLKATTGKGFFEFVGEKMLPEKVFQNPVVQTILKGGKIDHQELVRKFAEDKLPPEMIETIKTFETMKSDPQAFVRSKMYNEVMTVVEGNPRLKQTYQSFKEAEQFIKNPGLIEQKLEESLKKYGQQALKKAGDKAVQSIMDPEHAEKLKAHLEAYRERLERIQADGEASIENFTTNVAAGIARNLQNSLEETVGLKTEITPFVQELVEGYRFTD